MALGIKTTTAKQIGDILFSDGVFSVFSDTSLSKKEFNAYSGQELGVITAISSSYIEVDFDDPYEGVVSRYFAPKSACHPMPNPDFDYQGVTIAPDGTQTAKSGGFVGFLQTLFGFGTEVLKKTNSTTTKDATVKDPATGKDVVDPNASGDNSSSTSIWLFVGAGVLLIILLIVIFWKPKPKVPVAPPTTDAPQVIKLS